MEHAQHLELGALVGAASRLGLQGGGAVTRHGLQPGPAAAGHPLRGSRYHRSRGVVDIDFGVGTRVSGLRQGKQQMGVAVDQTGHHHLAGGVDDVPAPRDAARFSSRRVGPTSWIKPSRSNRAPSGMMASSRMARPRRGPCGPRRVSNCRAERIRIAGTMVSL